MQEVMRGIWPFYGVMFAVLMLVTYIPRDLALAAADVRAVRTKDRRTRRGPVDKHRRDAQIGSSILPERRWP